MGNETAAATQNQSDAKPSTEAPGTLLATAGNEAGTQTQPTETQSTQSTEKPAGTETTGQETNSATEAAAKPADGSAENKPAPGAPEKYEDFKAPEGMQFDPQVIESYTAAAKEANLTQDAAQKLIEKMAPALAQRQLEQVKAIHTEWTEQSKSDKEFGGDKFKENMGVARKAYDAFDPIPQGQTTTPLRTLLETTGLGNHPEIIRLLYRAGKAISGDTFVTGKPAETAGKDPTDALYPTMKK